MPSAYKTNILKYFTTQHVCTLCSTSVTLNKKRNKIIMMNGEVFSIHHSDLHWAHQCSTGSYKCLFIWWFVCVIWKQNTILRILHMCFWFVCRVLRVWDMLSENVCKQSRKTVTHHRYVSPDVCSLYTERENQSNLR